MTKAKWFICSVLEKKMSFKKYTPNKTALE